MNTVLIIYLVLSLIEAIHFIYQTNKVDNFAVTVPTGDLEFYKFNYPNESVLLFFFPAFLLVKCWMLVVSIVNKHF